MRSRLLLATSIASISAMAMPVAADSEVYAGFPVTLNGYQGDAETSVSYNGQMARHVLHNSLKKLVSSSTGTDPEARRELLLSYFSGSEAGRDIISPVSKDGFPVLQSEADDISSGSNLAGKVYAGTVNGWPGQMTGVEVLNSMIEKAAGFEGGYDPVNGYNYTQLISKFTMGAVFYHQAVDTYLDERIEAGVKPNDKPYKEGARYTGKEHVWDEAFGYFGAPAHTLKLDAATAYGIAKQNPDTFDAADANNDGKVDLVTEMTYAHAYYAANADKSGQSDYLHTITRAFIDGRQLIADADGEALSTEELAQLSDYADIIKSNWERVIAEAAFKYAGSVYSDIQALVKAMEEGESVTDLMADYTKHWGELKGFALSLQVSGKDLGATGVKLNRLIGYSPVLFGNTQVNGMDANGDYTQAGSITLNEYAVNMLEVQKLLAKEFHLVARSNDKLGEMDQLLKKLDTSGASVEND